MIQGCKKNHKITIT